ncbi:MAG: hypothetical protein JRF43_01910 [Deltaproteobacteria bacterium]|nr:hypothetical protein [Deltaproteobacteria bacterium]
MKRKKMLVMATVFAMLFGLAQIVVAATSNQFTTTDGDSDIINFYGLADGCYFGVYDFDDNPLSGSDPHLDLLLGSSSLLFESAEFSVIQSGTGGTWVITVESGLNIGNSINIGPTEDFGFYFWNGSTYDTNFTITSGGGDAYSFLSTNTCGTVFGDDLNQVPLTGSAIFLFSGIMGLVAFGSRRKIMK